MNRTDWIKVLLVTAALVTSATAAAAKIRPINEIPQQVPETAEEREIWAIGRAHQQQVRGSSELVNDPQLESYLEGVASRLYGPLLAQIGITVDVLVFKDPTVNAWVYPDGTIAVQTGLLAAMDNEAQLAAILGHEISHFLNRHAYIRIAEKNNQKSFGLLQGTAASLPPAAGPRFQADLSKVGAVWTELVTSGYSRKLESEADAQGLELLVAAHYPPGEALPAFEALRIPEDNTANIDKVWSSHPDIDSRLRSLQKAIRKIKNPAATVPASLDYYRAVAPALAANVLLDMQQRNYPKAIAATNKYILANPSDPNGYFTLGEIERKQAPDSAFEPRMQAYRDAIARDPDFADAHKELGMALRQQGKKEQAADAFKRYLALAEQAPEAGIIRGYLEGLQ